jgi:hypothetical protein
MNQYEIQIQVNQLWQVQLAGEAKSRRAFIKANKYEQKKGTQTRVVKV